MLKLNSLEMEKEAERIRMKAKVKKLDLDENQVCEKVTKRMQSRGVLTPQLRVDDIGFTEELTDIAGNKIKWWGGGEKMMHSTKLSLLITVRIAACTKLKKVRKMLNKETPPSLMSSAGFGGYVAGGGSAIVPLGRGSTIDRSKDKEPVISSNFLLSLSHDLLETQTAHLEEKSISYQQVHVFS